LKKFYINIFLLSIIFSAFSFIHNNPVPPSGTIKLQFITYNGFGNNLYIDNLLIGKRPVFDFKITGILNIPNDTFYTAVQDSITVIPEAKVTNFGDSAVSTPVPVKMTIDNILYSSSYDISLNAGETKIISFDTLRIPAGIPLNIKVFTSLDSIGSNDTLMQSSLMLNGATRNVLFEEFTSTTSNSCGNNNPFLDNFINNNFANICAIKYHLGYPPPGNDTMYLQNPVTPDQRKNYYFINAIPSTLADGVERIFLPYSRDSNIIAPLVKRMALGSPLSVSVRDTRLAGDSIKSLIVLNVLQNLKAGNYKLRAMAVERLIQDSISPGINGETMFFDVFRFSLTDSDGVTINSTQGIYQFEYNYLRQPQWVDSMIYTVAFVQNDDSKEVINCGKGRNFPLKNSGLNKLFSFFNTKPDRILYSNQSIYNNNINFSSIFKTNSQIFKAEIFENYFPPSGWQIFNKDISYTFTQIQGYNGPAIGGNNCIKVPFYEYGNIGQRDSLISVNFYDVSSSDTLRFDYAYAQYLSNYNDSLIVKLSTDDGITYSTIFARSGTTLATAPSSTLPFAPNSSSEWRTFYYPLSQILPPSNTSKPETYTLYQNFPNPFNPKTTIRYQIPKSVFVTLKVYDITGREIKVLINEEQKQGIYEAIFDGTNYASGVYFYVLKTGEFRDARKMILVK